jgi:hypothetical protein
MNTLCLITLAAAMPLSVSAGQQPAGFKPIPVNTPQQASAAPAAPEAVPQQSEPAEHAVTPPKVTCRGNIISISAKYSRLGAILTDLQKCTGVQFDSPEDAKMSLIFDEIGPGTSADVVAALLSSSGYDFVIGASADDPEKIEKVILLARSSDKNAGPGSASADGREATPLRRAFDQMRETARPKPPEVQRAQMEAAQAEADANDANAPAENASAPAVGDASAAAPAEAAQAPQADDSSSAAKPASPVSDKIADMQKLFEQRRQMIQQTQQQTPPQQPGQTQPPPQPEQPQQPQQPQ